MSLLGFLAIGFASGLHASMFGAYKDSPHESFKPFGVVREMILTLSFAGFLYWGDFAAGETPFIIYLSIFTLARIATEFWKVFVRTENQKNFRIPTQIHLTATVIDNRLIRLILGLLWLVGIYGLYHLCKWMIPKPYPIPIRGMLIGLTVGFFEACCGGYKDGCIEGFSWAKFAKSPVFGALGGLIASGHTQSWVYLFLGGVGSMRMFLELLFKMVVPDYAPGKFKSIKGPFEHWTAQRHRFIPYYVFTWGLYAVLATHPNW